MLLGAARLLKERESDLKGTVLLVFQPAEEGGAGADVMIQEGALEGASAAYAMHVWPTVPTGQLATRSGTIMAGVSWGAAGCCHLSGPLVLPGSTC
jgi:IAA-amino acid hydrolase